MDNAFTKAHYRYNFEHLILKQCPTLRTIENSENLICHFIEKRISADWLMHVEILKFLLADAASLKNLDQTLVLELLAATASRWTRYDSSPACSIKLSSSLIPYASVIATKPVSLGTERKVFLSYSKPKLNHEPLFHYEVSYEA